jgi:hypothetical protein
VNGVSVLETFLIVAVCFSFLMHGVTLFHLIKARSDIENLSNGSANAFAIIGQNLQGVAELPQLLSELNLGGVQLMPQKTLGETILEGIMSHFWGNNDETKIIEPDKLETADAPETED